MEDQVPQNSEEIKNSIPQMRTFSSDLAVAMKEKGGSIVKIALEEEEKRQKEKESAPLSKSNAPFFIIGIILIVLAIGGIIYMKIYIAKINATVPIQQTQTIQSIIASGSDTSIDISYKNPTDVYQEIRNKLADNSLRSGSIENVSLLMGTSTRASTSQFLDSIKSHAPLSTLNAFSSGNYMLGIYSYNGNNLFIILQGTQHDYVFAGMLAWEPYLLEDMAPLFSVNIIGNNDYLLNVPFSGTVVENHDTRAVLDKDKKTAIFYSFLDPNTIVITTDPTTLTQVSRIFNQNQ